MHESHDTEFKEEYTEKMIKTVVAFSNTVGGKILFGVNDAGEIIGLADPDDTSKKCVNAIADKIRPDVTMNTDVKVEDKGEKTIVVVNVQEGNKKPYYLREKGLRAEGVYVREGTSSVPVTDEKLQKMIAEIRSKAYETQISSNQQLTFDYLKSKFDKQLLTLTEENMRSLFILDGNRYTKLGFILSDQYDVPIRVAAFEDEYRSKFIERAEYTGSILKQIDETSAFLSRYNKQSSTIAGMYREDTYSYSETSIREALINAFVHRDYSVDDSILISVYPSKMTFVSPGGLNRHYSIEEMKAGVSSLRNRNLAAILFRLKMIETYGTGIPRIFGAYDGRQNIPTINARESTFSISLPMLETETDEITQFLQSNPEFTRSQLEDYFKITKSEATQRIKMLIEMGRIYRKGEGRSVKYRVNRKP